LLFSAHVPSLLSLELSALRELVAVRLAAE
jgi:hypothetical protein